MSCTYLNIKTVKTISLNITLLPITFISRINALDYTKLGSYNLQCIKILKDIKLKITPTCFGSCAIHHQGVYSCT